MNYYQDIISKANEKMLAIVDKSINLKGIKTDMFQR